MKMTKMFLLRPRFLNFLRIARKRRAAVVVPAVDPAADADVVPPVPALIALDAADLAVVVPAVDPAADADVVPPVPALIALDAADLAVVVPAVDPAADADVVPPVPALIALDAADLGVADAALPVPPVPNPWVPDMRHKVSRATLRRNNYYLPR